MKCDWFCKWSAHARAPHMWYKDRIELHELDELCCFFPLPIIWYTSFYIWVNYFRFIVDSVHLIQLQFKLLLLSSRLSALHRGKKESQKYTEKKCSTWNEYKCINGTRFSSLISSQSKHRILCNWLNSFRGGLDVKFKPPKDFHSKHTFFERYATGACKNVWKFMSAKEFEQFSLLISLFLCWFCALL